MWRLAVAASVSAALAASSVALAATTVSGTYRTTITSTALDGLVKGTWTVVFKGGVITAAKNGIVATHGKYSIAGSKITFRPAPGQDRCPTVSVYRFQASGARLKFTLISGSSSNPSCVAQKLILAGSFTKVG